ncbi:hypothetical protein BDN72DRAFT_841699, partial [Pluteus cervinus]
MKYSLVRLFSFCLLLNLLTARFSTVSRSRVVQVTGPNSKLWAPSSASMRMADGWDALDMLPSCPAARRFHLYGLDVSKSPTCFSSGLPMDSSGTVSNYVLVSSSSRL